MAIDLSTLPDEVRALIAAQAATIARQQTELDGQQARIAQLRAQLAKLRRMQFGRSSEKLDTAIVQLELMLEDLEEDGGARSQSAPASAPCVEADGVAKPARRPLPAHLPRDVVEHATACACPKCGGTLRRLSEDVTEVLDYVPASFRVIRHVRPKFSCRSCETITQAPSPSLPIRRGRAGPGLLAHVLVAKFCDHLPLYRQSEIYARDGVELERSTLADWVGQAAALLRPLVDALEHHVMAGTRLRADDTPVPVLAPGTGKTSTGRLWAYLRDERPYDGDAPPCATDTVQIEEVNALARIWSDSAACCRPMAMLALLVFTKLGTLSKRRAGHMRGANSTISTPPVRHRLHAKCWNALLPSTPLKNGSAESRPICAARFGKTMPNRCWIVSRRGWKTRASRYQGAAISQPQSATPCPAGRH